tara:strand:+ start:962 stop:1189 length:228 start_codon:yes stop_codon:yes gene_type:complete
MTTQQNKDKTIFYYPEEPDLDTIQKTVEGYFAIVPLLDNKMMYVNEEGALKNLPVNSEASEIAGFKIYGKVLIIG